MTPDALFQWANPLALVGWLALAFLPLAPRLLGLVAGTVVPLLLSTAYAALALSFWSSSTGGFDSLEAVARLFDNRWLLLAGWVHYLAFDLLIGAWEARTARREGIAHGLLLPCLAVTFLFGPAGYLLFQGVRLSLRARSAQALR
ncbi:MAG: ABA4-like family protein [Acidovorax sp.]